MATPSNDRPLQEFSVRRWPIFGNPLPAYGCALGLTAIAFLIRWNFDSMFGNSGRLIFFLLAAALSAFLFGRGPGIFATIVGTLTAQYFFVAPRLTFHFETRSSVITFVLALCNGFVISICAGYLHRALRIRQQAEAEVRHLYEAERRAHEAAGELNRTKDYFLAVLSHELRGPLSAITYCVADRLKDASLSGPLREDFDLIDRNVRMQSRLIGDLLDLTRLTRGKMEIEKHPMDIHALLIEAVRTSTGDGQLLGPIPILNLQAAECRVLGDRDRLLQVLWNILRNAAKFTPHEGRIEVETFEPAPGRIAIRIRDSGVGLTGEALKRIFHPFEQAGLQTNRKHGGLGLGLAIARGIVELHEGILTGASAGLGQGTTFTIELPVAGRVTAPATAASAAAAASAASAASTDSLIPVGVDRPPVPVG
jgi:signal transduction histidine kinase